MIGPPTAAGRAIRLHSLAALLDPLALAPVLGPIDGVEERPVSTIGKSGGSHARVSVRLRSGEALPLWLKRNQLWADWEASLTGDTLGREVMALEDPALAGAWQVFHCPVRAYAVEETSHGRAFGLLMDDLGPGVVSEETRLSEAHEDLLLAALARLHAHYWDAAVAQPGALPWLMTLPQALNMLSPRSAAEQIERGAPTRLFEWVSQGWTALFARVPAPVADLLRNPAPALAAATAGLPRTLLHGNTRVGNFAFLPDGRVAAFDWADASAGPPTFDVCWYLILNAKQRARRPEAILERYRAFLERERDAPLPDALWQRLIDAGILYAAAMLLWDRTLDLEEGEPGADEEWRWWISHLDRLRAACGTTTLYYSQESARGRLPEPI
jgi:hypothetical protein